MAKNRNSTRYKSNIQEKRIASLFNDGKQVIGSGATPFLKGDVITDEYFIECKTKMQESTQITVKKEWIEKARDQAYQMRKPYYLLALSFGDGNDYFLSEVDLILELQRKAEAFDKIYEITNTPGIRAEGLEDALSEVLKEYYPEN